MTAVAAPTPASDGQRVFAYFSSNDLVALDIEGNLLWTRGLTLEHPQSGNDVGLASSPLVAGDTVIVQVECQGDSFAAGFAVDSGVERWRIARPSRGNWSSPTLLHRTADSHNDFPAIWCCCNRPRDCRRSSRRRDARPGRSRQRATRSRPPSRRATRSFSPAEAAFRRYA